MTTVHLVKRDIDGTPGAEHWATLFGDDLLLEIDGSSRNTPLARTRAASSYGSGASNVRFLRIGTTTMTRAQAIAVHAAWCRVHPTYHFLASNCQNNAKDVIASLCPGAGLPWTQQKKIAVWSWVVNPVAGVAVSASTIENPVVRKGLGVLALGPFGLFL